MAWSLERYLVKIIYLLSALGASIAMGDGLRIHRIDKLGAHHPRSPRFDHVEARAEAKKVFLQLASLHNWNFTQSSDSEIFTEEGLREIDVIVFDNNSGLLLNDVEKQCFENWLRNGGGVVGIHGVCHAHKGVNDQNEADWPFWYGLWGVLHKSGPKEGPMGRRGYADWVRMVSDQDEWTRHLPERWQFEKVEWYFYHYHANFEQVHVIATADVKQNQPELPGYYPVSWCQDYEGGRIWYTNMGHYAENFHQKEFSQHVVDGIEWAGRSGE